MFVRSSKFLNLNHKGRRRVEFAAEEHERGPPTSQEKSALQHFNNQSELEYLISHSVLFHFPCGIHKNDDSVGHSSWKLDFNRLVKFTLEKVSFPASTTSTLFVHK